jgi:hypothetical protein
MVKKPTMRQLTQEERDRIADKDAWEDVFLEAWRVVMELHGDDFDAATRIDPTKYVMWEEDWVWVASVLGDKGTSAVASVNVMLEWMNRGPSACRGSLGDSQRP